MLEYDIDEAQALLEKNLSTASRNLETLEDDLDFLRDQFTTTEVSILPLRGPSRLSLQLIPNDGQFSRCVVALLFLGQNISRLNAFIMNLFCKTCVYLQLWQEPWVERVMTMKVQDEDRHVLHRLQIVPGKDGDINTTCGSLWLLHDLTIGWLRVLAC